MDGGRENRVDRGGMDGGIEEGVDKGREDKHTFDSNCCTDMNSLISNGCSAPVDTCVTRHSLSDQHRSRIKQCRPRRVYCVGLTILIPGGVMRANREYLSLASIRGRACRYTNHFNSAAGVAVQVRGMLPPMETL